MLWKFSFTSGASLESLFTRETPPSVEEVMDEKDVLNECKGQNQRCVFSSVCRGGDDGVAMWNGKYRCEHCDSHTTARTVEAEVFTWEAIDVHLSQC